MVSKPITENLGVDVAGNAISKGVQAMLAVMVKKSTRAWHKLLKDGLSMLQSTMLWLKGSTKVHD